MKKILVFFTILTLFAFSCKKAIAVDAAQAAAVTQAETDYRFQFDQYRAAHDTYVTAKAEFLKNGNLKTQQDALVAAKAAAMARAEVLKAYTRWITLRLNLYLVPFPQVGVSVTALNKQMNWYLDEQAKIQAAGTQGAFEAIMDEYVKTQEERDRLYARAEIELKLGQVASFQQQARALYDPLLVKLQAKTTIPEVAQGMATVASLGEDINALILDTETKSGAVESGDLGVFQALRQASDKLETLRTKQLTLVNTMIELESRYGQ